MESHERKIQKIIFCFRDAIRFMKIEQQEKVFGVMIEIMAPPRFSLGPLS